MNKFYRKKKYYNIYIIKMYDPIKSRLKKKLKFKIYIGFDKNINNKFLDLIITKTKHIFKGKNKIIKFNFDYSYFMKITKRNPYIFSIRKYIYYKKT